MEVITIYLLNGQILNCMSGFSIYIWPLEAYTPQLANKPTALI